MTPQMSLSGRVFTNRYEIQREIAQGGMAEVYLARDRMLERNVALKALFPEYAREQSFVERFRREAQAAANLNHPNIVAIYDWGQESGTYFIVMEAVEGRSLRDLIRSESPIDPTQSAEICAEIAGALAFAHSNDLVHRDVKPGNVLITPAGDVKVTDFGIARAGATDGLTQTGSVMGTATYFSPEQAQGLDVDGRSDVYSLGVVLYEMLTGVAPFTGDSPVSVAYKHVREAPVPPSQRNPSVPEDLEMIVLTAMAKDPDRRYQTADDLRADLVRFQRGRPLAAAPVTALYDDYDNDATVAAAAVGGNTAVGSPVAYAPKRRGGTIAALFTILLLVGVVFAILWFTTNQDEPTPVGLVPDVVGLEEQNAIEQLTEAGFEAEVLERVQNEEVPEGEVLSQDPEGQTELAEGETVTLVVSAGVGTVEVPEVVGINVFEAVPLLESAGLNVEIEEVNNDFVPQGQVISANPDVGTEVSVGSTVSIVVSAGAERIEVPDVDGLSESEAFTVLTAAEFRVQTVSENSSSVSAGNVIRTDPPGASEAPRGSTVQMFVSIGPAQVEVPRVIGLDEASARATLEGLGFTVSTTLVPEAAVNDGVVVNQNPSPFANADPGSQVDIFVGDFTPPTTVPPTTVPPTTVPPTTVPPTTAP